MEMIIAVVIVIALAYWFHLFSKLEQKRYKKHIYVFKKTGHYYYVHRCIKVKHPDTGKWFDAIAYTNNNDNHKVYAREEKDFYDKFVPFNEWKEEHGSKN